MAMIFRRPGGRRHAARKDVRNFSLLLAITRPKVTMMRHTIETVTRSARLGRMVRRATSDTSVSLLRDGAGLCARAARDDCCSSPRLSSSLAAGDFFGARCCGRRSVRLSLRITARNSGLGMATIMAAATRPRAVLYSGTVSRVIRCPRSRVAFMRRAGRDIVRIIDGWPTTRDILHAHQQITAIC